MNKELLELLEAKKVLRSKIENAQNMEELNSLKDELNALENKEALIIERSKMAQKLANNPAAGNTLPVPGKGMEEKPDLYSSVEYRSAFMKYVLSGGREEIPVEMRADAVTKTTDVGAVIPTTIINRIIEDLEATGMILREVTQTALKGGVSYPPSSVKPVATWVAEGAGSDKQKKTTGSITFAYHKLRCAVAITLETSVVALAVFESVLVRNIAEAMLKAVEQAIVSGDGSGKPKGIITETPKAGQSIDVTAAITYENVVTAEAALPLAYESGAAWCMSKKTFMGFVGQTDSNGQPIARVNYGTTGTPERFILGRRVILTDYLPPLTASTTKNTVVAFIFNFKDYALNTNYNMGMKKYEDNETDDEVMKAIMLADGKVLDKGSLVILKAGTVASGS